MKRCTHIALVLMLLLIGCKPVHTIQERYVTTVDSTAILTLKEVINKQLQELHEYRIALDRSRQENTRLSNEILIHTINYNTDAILDTTTGKYPIASETTTSSKSILEKEIKERELLLQEQEREIKVLTQKSNNLEYQVEALKEGSKELSNKTKRFDFSFKWLLYGMVLGCILTVVGLILWKMK